MSSISYGLLIALAIALVFAAFTDIRRRQIDNWLNAAIALTAPAFWWASGLALWPDVAIQLGVALAAFLILAGLFALKVMGGGDVKLLAALALWVPFYEFLQLLLIMSLAGGALTIMVAGWHVIRGQRDRIAV
ncbi:MAG: peptidase, partial [Sphingomonadales bacterium]